MEEFAASVVLIAILLGVLLLIAFDVFCLVHLATADRVRFLPKLAWAVAIVCISPFGGLVYLLSQRQPKAIVGFLLRAPTESGPLGKRGSLPAGPELEDSRAADERALVVGEPAQARQRGG